MLTQSLVLLFVLGAEAAPSGTPSPTPVSSRQRTLADVARENRERTERREGTLSIAGVGAPAPEPPPTPSAGARGRRSSAIKGREDVVAASAPGTASGAVDRARDESYWRDKTQRLRSELETAQAAYAAENERARKLLTQAKTTEEANRLGEELKKTKLPCRIRVESAQRELDALPEQARRAGADPGWVR